MPGKKARTERQGRQDVRGPAPRRRIVGRIANAGAQKGRSRSSVGAKGGQAGSYEDWNVDGLRKRAKQLGLSGYSGKKKSELVSMLRDH